MSWYTAGEILVWLLIAAILGFILGWLLHALLRGRKSGARIAELESQLADCEASKTSTPAKTTKLARDEAAVAEARRKVAEIASRTAAGTSVADDLQRIKGVGPVIDDILKDLGITSFRQVARFTDEDVATVTEALEVFPGRIERDGWIASARALHREVYGEDPLA